MCVDWYVLLEFAGGLIKLAEKFMQRGKILWRKRGLGHVLGLCRYSDCRFLSFRGVVSNHKFVLGLPVITLSNLIFTTHTNYKIMFLRNPFCFFTPVSTHFEWLRHFNLRRTWCAWEVGWKKKFATTGVTGGRGFESNIELGFFSEFKFWCKYYYVYFLHVSLRRLVWLHLNKYKINLFRT